MPSERRAIAHRDLEALGRFIRLKTLDDGISGHNGVAGSLNQGVFLVRRIRDGKTCVQKRIPTSNNALLNEIKILQALYHPNICQYIDGFISEDDPPPLRASLYMEYCDLGSVETLLRKYREHSQRPRARAYIPEAFIWKTFLELSSALQYLHHGIEAGGPFIPKDPPAWRRVLHRDIKPANIFLKSGPYLIYPTVVLGDFGCATKYGIQDWNDITSIIGTRLWQPPEIPKHTARGDVWSLGAVIQALCRLDEGPVGPPPSGADHDSWWMSSESRRPKRAGKYYSKQLNCVLASALAMEKDERPFAYELYREVKYFLRIARRELGLCDEPFPTWAFDRRYEIS
ncbi:MAG: hypothetical protein M1830_002680 [Pleopsidium flavum]|nr:MAG: hypothetical protein M1830_002680 [Pleopsidium flavum]